MPSIDEMAKDLGHALGRIPEYQALKQATESLNDDRELVGLRNELEKIESKLVAQLRIGQEPDASVQKKYEGLAESLQVRPVYQRLVVSQANFDKVLQRVNDTIAKGIQEGASGRIILPS
jgi:cell fate (sporulation/competence/biofilm development) regulator YlbF (YheA/YmcA/DUF963 family)